MGNQALILRACVDLDGAMSLLKRAERLCCRRANTPTKDGLQSTLGGEASIL